jgi:hypothetical protein
MDGAAPVRPDRLLCRQPGDLVAELQPRAVLHDQAGGEDLVDERG